MRYMQGQPERSDMREERDQRTSAYKENSGVKKESADWRKKLAMMNFQMMTFSWILRKQKK